MSAGSPPRPAWAACGQCSIFRCATPASASDRTYYLTGTTGHPTWWNTNEGVRLWKSANLRDWEPLGLVWSFATDATWQVKRGDQQAIWAPEIHFFHGTFWIAYCVNYGGTGVLRSTSGRPEGPYVDIRKDGPLTGEIDASLFRDDDGKVWFVYQNGKIAPLNADVGGLAAEPVLLQPEGARQVGFEGAFVFKANGRYYLSCADFTDGRYHCYVASADQLAGPYGKRRLAIPHAGHNMFFRDLDGDWWSTFFGNDSDAPFQERPALLPVEFGLDGTPRPALARIPGALAPWPGQAPADCPFPPSDTFVGLHFTGRHASYTGADTWYPSWAADGNLYSPWTDGNVSGLGCSSAGENAATGHATILGDDPLDLTIIDPGTFPSSPRPYEGRYPCGSLVHDGVWYYGTYCLHPGGGIPRDGVVYNWPWLGPFVGFRWSTDFGQTWHQTPCTPAQPLFDEHALNGEPVKIGAPHFVDFGRAMEHSPDGKAYLVGHGASDGQDRRFAYNSWITGDQVHLARVTPAIETINDAAHYEFFAGHRPDGKPVWSDQVAEIKPLAEWRDHMGCVTMTYNAPLRKYLMCVTDGGNTVSRYHTYLLESDRITGPWKMAAYLRDFGEQAYFVNIPSKFIGGDGRTFWLCYSANFSSGWGGTTFDSRPPGSGYAMCLQEVRLLTAADPLPPPTSPRSPRSR